MPSDAIETVWIHVLLRGEHTRTRPSADKIEEADQSYPREFASRSLNAIQVPILEFKFNLEGFRDLIEGAKLPQTTAKRTSATGLIFTSPRAVEWVALARNEALIGFETNKSHDAPSSHRQGSVHSDASISSKTPVDTRVVINEGLVFVVGSKTADHCAKKLNVRCHPKSIETGNVAELAKMIGEFCENHSDTQLTLFYPKSSLADSTLEQTLSTVTNLSLVSFVAYETSCLVDPSPPLAASLTDYLIKRAEADVTESRRLTVTDRPKRYVINLIFFSPSGVDGFCRGVNLEELAGSISSNMSRAPSIVFRFSCIGPTTELALRRHKLDVFHVARKPSAESLVEGLVSACAR